MTVSLVQQGVKDGSGANLFFDRSSGKLTFEGKDYEIYGNGDFVHGKRRATIKIQGLVGRINYKYRLRQFRNYDGPIFETAQ